MAKKTNVIKLQRVMSSKCHKNLCYTFKDKKFKEIVDDR